jgi:hypothetical protein
MTKASNLTKAEAALLKSTDGWSKAMLVRSYSNERAGIEQAEGEANILSAHGYEVVGQSGAGSHVNVRRTKAIGSLFGGGTLVGVSRTKGTVQITFKKSDTIDDWLG